MKTFAATCETQGARDNDFCWTVEGELVCFPAIECDCGTIDGDCGCRRAMAGLSSHGATTTMKVIERKNLDWEMYYDLISNGYKSQGYVTEKMMEEQDVRAWLRERTQELIQLADPWPVGTVVERRGDFICVRTKPEDLN